MAVTIAIVKETADHEKRVAATPETVKKLAALGAKIVIQRGAGEAASYIDKAYEDAGATLASSAADAISGADVVLKVQAGASDVDGVPSGKILIGQFAPYQNTDVLKSAAAKKRHGPVHGTGTPYYARAGDGRSLLAIKPRGI